MASTSGRGYPASLEHFAIGERFGVSPVDVLEWPEAQIEEARAIMRGEKHYRDRNPTP